LIHIADDAHRFGILDNISAFPFENYLGKLKKLIRKPSQPLVQVVHRLTEQGSISKSLWQNKSQCKLKKKHFSGPVPNQLKGGLQYESVIINDKRVATIHEGDNCFQISEDIVLVKNIIQLNGVTYLVFSCFTNCGSLVDYPFPSCKVGIYLISNLSNNLLFLRIDKISAKLVLFPHICPGSYVALTMLHTFDNCP